MPEKKKHVFLSYCHENQAEVSKLRDELLAGGEAVWFDQDILGGQEWELETRKAMKEAYAIVLCLSAELTKRIHSGVYPEIRDAIAAYRLYAPGSIYLLPVRLSDSELPALKIDDTHTLDSLQHIDLFPVGKRGAGIEKLLAAIRKAPLHPQQARRN